MGFRIIGWQIQDSVCLAIVMSLLTQPATDRTNSFNICMRFAVEYRIEM